jgi:uncharacterized protein YprB with RNaseH-like and TPR domain
MAFRVGMTPIDLKNGFGFAGPRLQKKLDDYIPLSRAAIKNQDAAFFQRLSAMGEAWRVFPEFADEAVYLDIESTGLSTVFDSVTIVGLYDGMRYSLFTQGDNLDEVQRALAKYSVVVTFNGAGFDLRFLKNTFPELVLRQSILIYVGSVAGSATQAV